MKTVNYLITDKTISVNFDNKTFVISSTDESRYNDILSLIKKNDEQGIKTYLNPADAVIKYANHYFLVTDKGRLYMIDRPDECIPFVIANKLMDHLRNDIPLEPLVKFWYNLRENPSETSRQSLYSFLEKHNHPITEEGNFIAYRKVVTKGSILVDPHTGTMDNSVGKTVKMDRAACDADVNKACSTGLHVASLSFAKNFTGDTLIVVVVNPKDVVAVPKGEDSKMRVCEFKVIGKYEEPGMTDKIAGYDGKSILAKIPNDPKFTGPAPVIEAHTAKKKKTISMKGKTAREIIEHVALIFGEKITLDTSNKKGIIKKAILIAEKAGFKVQF